MLPDDAFDDDRLAHRLLVGFTAIALLIGAVLWLVLWRMGYEAAAWVAALLPIVWLVVVMVGAYLRAIPEGRRQWHGK